MGGESTLTQMEIEKFIKELISDQDSKRVAEEPAGK
jgi:hypothetical protein